MPLLPQRISPLRNSGDAVYLDFLPQDLKISEVIALILVFVGRQILHVLGLAHQPLLKSGASKEAQRYELPGLSLSMPFRVRKGDLDQYARAVNLAESGHGVESRTQKCLFLSALSMPAMLLLLAHHKSPIRPLGSVNVRNRFELLQPELCSTDALLGLERTEVRARFLKEAREVKRGLEIDLSVEVVTYDGGKAVLIFRQVFTMLQFMKIKRTLAAQEKTEASGDHEFVWLNSKSTPVTLAFESPRAWAAICKDYNPIHVSTLAAKLFGFPSKIAHGNFALAFAIARLEDAGEFSGGRELKALSMEVQFRRPISLPAHLIAESTHRDMGIHHLRLMRQEKVCLTAAITEAAGS